MKPSMYDKLIPINFDFSSHDKGTDTKTRTCLMETVFSKEHRAYSYTGTDEDNYKKLPKKWQKDEKLCLFLLDKYPSNYCFFCPAVRSNIKICLNLFDRMDHDKIVELIDFVPVKVKNNVDFIKMVAKNNIFNISLLNGNWLKNDEIIDIALKHEPTNFFHALDSIAKDHVLFLSVLDKKWLKDDRLIDIALTEKASQLFPLLDKEDFTLDFIVKAFKANPHATIKYLDENPNRTNIKNAMAFENELQKQDSGYWVECFKNLNKEWIDGGQVNREEFESDFALFDFIVNGHLTVKDIEKNFVDNDVSFQAFDVVREKVRETIQKMKINDIQKTDKTNKNKRKMALS